MPKKTKKGKKEEILKKQELEEENSQESAEEEENEEENLHWSLDLTSAIENLSDKKSKTRIESLQTLKKLLQKHFCYEVLSKDSEILKNLMSNLSHGEEEEGILAGQTIELLIFTLGDLNEDQVSKLETLLLHKSRDSELTPNLRHATINALASLHFVCSDSTDITKEEGHLDEFKKYFWKEKDITEAGIHAWTFLLSSLDTSDRASELERSKQQLFKLLEEKNFETTLEIGDAFGLLYESLYLISGKDKNMRNIYEKIEELSKVYTKKKSKKDKYLQRSTFKEVLDMIESNIPPSPEKITISGITFEFSSWKQIIRYHQLKERLGSGFMEHFKHNPLVKNVFEIKNMIF